jgi:twitching motility protein PilJ
MSNQYNRASNINRTPASSSQPNKQDLKRLDNSIAIDNSDRQKALQQWFKNLPIARKQLIVVGTSLISIIGLIGAGGLILSEGLHDQILEQAKSENAVVDINYKIKINQMGFGFRGQSDNVAIIEAAVQDTKSNTVKPELQDRVKKILQNEIKARKIEYATLVGKDLRIIVNANANRQGETFNPDGLVAEVFQDTRQIKATSVVSEQELKKEASPLPEGFSEKNALIRYTVTPVFDPVTKKPIAALVSGDIVNGKANIVANTLQAIGRGYSAIYFRQADGQFALASALYQGKNDSLENASKNRALPDTAILSEAVKTPGKAVATEVKLDGETYALSALAIPNIYKEEATGTVAVEGRGEPVAILVRGTPENKIEAILYNSLLVQIALGGLILAANVALAIAIGRTIARPIEELQQTTQKFAKGDRRARAKLESIDEVGRLSATFNQLAESIIDNESALKQEATKLELARQQTEQLAQQERQRSQALQGELMRFIGNVEAASQGNLTVRADISEGEIGIVADMFNSIIESVRDIIQQVKQAANQVNSSVGKNETVVRQLSDNAIEQVNQINQTLNSVEAMTISIQQVAENAKAAAEVARAASTTAQMGEEDMEQTADSIMQLRETVTETQKKIKSLGEASRRISKVVTLINQIAMETNLLAVNASIEAARAGEEGQGFAVVASEVGQLAAQSAAATKEIQQIVDSIQQETTAAVKAIKASSDRVEEGTQQLERTKQSLGKIAIVSRQIDELLQSISQATVSQVNTSEMVTQLMEEIAKVSQKNSGSSIEVSGALQETVEIAKQLQKSVGTFKVA